MKKALLVILLILIILISWKLLFIKPNLKGFYQTEINGYHVQMLIREADNSFTEWIDNRQVDKGNYEKLDENLYRIKGSKQDFEITLNPDNSFEIIVKKLNNGNPILMKNIDTNDVPISFGTKFDDVDEYRSLLD